MTQNSVEAAFADQFPKSGIIKPKKRFCPGPAILHMSPRVTVQQGDVPLHTAAEFRVVPRFRSSQTAVRYVEVQLGMLRHQSKNRGGVLHRMRRNHQDTEAALRHSRAFGESTRWRRKKGLAQETDDPKRKYTRFAPSAAVLNCLGSAGFCSSRTSPHRDLCTGRARVGRRRASIYQLKGTSASRSRSRTS